MKKYILIGLTLSFLGFITYAQTPDTTTVDTLKSDTIKQVQAIGSPQGLSNKQLADLILTISKNIFWDKYTATFRIGVTDLSTKYFLEKYMTNKNIHGKKVKVVLVNNQNYPKAEIILVPLHKNKDIDIILPNYSSNTIFVSENFEDRKKVDITILQKNNMYRIWINRPITDKKNVYILPQLWGYTIL